MERPESLGGAWWLYLVMGIVSLAGGVFALANPFIASVIVLQFVAAIFIIVGTMQVLFTLRSPFGLSWFDLMMGILQIVIGVVLATNVLGGLVSLTLILAILLLVEGIILSLAGFGLRPFRPWLWLVIAGAVSIILAVIVLAGLPGTATQLLGILLGIDLISNGAWLVVVALLLRQIP